MSDEATYSIGIPVLNRAELEETLRLLIHYGVKSYAHQNVGHIEFWKETPDEPEQGEVVTPSAIPLMGTDEMPSDEAMMFAATEDPDELDRVMKAAQSPEVTP